MRRGRVYGSSESRTLLARLRSRFLAEESIGRLYADARALTIGGGATEALVEALSRLVLPRAL